MANASVNKVTILGNLGDNPEMRTFPNGGAVANLTIATSESWRDKQTGEQREKTEWHRVAVFGKLAEVAGQYLRKGAPVYIEGALQTRKWQDQNGQDRFTTEVVVQGYQGIMKMLGPKPQENWGQPQPAPAPQQAHNNQPAYNHNQPAQHHQQGGHNQAPAYNQQ